jgi:hypothetical protein
MILNLILLGLFVYRSLNISGETVLVSERYWDVSTYCSYRIISLANKAIKR